jgi:hypothetical protein
VTSVWLYRAEKTEQPATTGEQAHLLTWGDYGVARHLRRLPLCLGARSVLAIRIRGGLKCGVHFVVSTNAGEKEARRVADQSTRQLLSAPTTRRPRSVFP